MLRSNYFNVIEPFLLLPALVICSIYDYGLFENFEITKASFIKEQKIVKELEQIRAYLYQRRYDLSLSEEQFKNNPVKEKLVNFQIKDLFENKYFKNKRDSSLDVHNELINVQRPPDGFNFHYNVSLERIVDGASRGIMMIHDTYDLDTKQFSNGYLSLRNGIETNSRKIDSLQPDDLASISTTAFNLHWYDTSLKYLKEAIDSFNQLSKEQRRDLQLPDNFESTLLQMRKSYAKYHNAMLMKKRNNVGPEWKLFPYLVDEGRNMKFSDHISISL